MSEHKRILVIKLSALGDFIQALGPMKAIRNHHKDAYITLLTTKSFSEFAEKSNYFDEIWIDDRPKFLQPQKWWSLKKKLNKPNFDRVYDLQNNDRTNLYFKLFNPSPEWVGVAKGASHRNISPKRTESIAFHGHVQTLGLAGIDHVSIDTLDWIDSDISRFNITPSYALIVPGSAANRTEKRWPARYYAGLCHFLKSKNIQPVLIGTEAESDVTSEIFDASPEAINLTAQTSLFDITPLARNAVISIGNDTGPMHMIAPTGCKTIVLFSKHSNPKRHAPLGNNVHTIQCDSLDNLSVNEVTDRINLLLQPEPVKMASEAP